MSDKINPMKNEIRITGDKVNRIQYEIHPT
jgi:hypothetical protein